MKLLRLLLSLALCCTFAAIPASADQADIAAASRSVVRVVMVANDGGNVAFVGHGSGFAIAPDIIITNAHVIELARTEPSISIGVIPSQGSKSYGARIIAISPNKDLALLKILDGGRLPPMTIYTGAITDGAEAIAIGYPASVDRAQGLDLEAMIEPLAPIKTRGSISGGRSAKDVETVLHTAPIASGNSGGPLTDNCGRVLGANSFGSTSDGNDAEFGFAVSNRELVAFLRAAKVSFASTTIACRSIAEVSAEEAQREALERDRVEQAARRDSDQKLSKQSQLKEQFLYEVIAERENRLALAGLLMVIALGSLGASGFFVLRAAPTPAKVFGGIAFFAILAGPLAYLTRPGFDQVEDRLAASQRTTQRPLTTPSPDAPIAASARSGTFICTIDRSRSRVTVSSSADVELSWQEGGCVNGRTQYGRDGDQWSRILVPNQEQTVTIASFDPDRRTYTVDRFMLGLDEMNAARQARQRYDLKSCTSDSDALTSLSNMIGEIRVTLPEQPNEHLVHKCRAAQGAQ